MKKEIETEIFEKEKSSKKCQGGERETEREIKIDR